MTDKDVVSKIPIICQTCAGGRVGDVRYSHAWGGQLVTGEPVEPPCVYHLVVCTTCGDAQFYYQDEIVPGQLEAPFRLWPQMRNMPTGVPDAIRQDWQEATTCFDMGVYTATVVLVRRVLEGISHEKGVSEKTLYKSLDALKDQGFIDENLRNWGHMLREIGNTGAHYSDARVSRDAALEALEFAEAFLNYVFVLRARYENYLQRQQKTKGQQQP